MKYAVLLVLLLSGPTWRLLTWVHARNAAVAAGTAAYQRGEAARAANAFEQALAAKRQRTPDPRLLLNLAHAQVLTGQMASAHATYGRLLTGCPATLSSVARQQLAVRAAQQGEIAQALALLRQALLLDPTNSGARYNYEVLSEYLAHRSGGPKIPPPPGPGQPPPAAPKNGAEEKQPAEKPGADRKGEINEPKPGSVPRKSPASPQPAAPDQPGSRAPTGGSGNDAGKRAPGAGTPQPVASGKLPGTERGLDPGSATTPPQANRGSNRPGTEAATASDERLQTQRERLQAMNLSPAQARQLLEALRAQEQQYLQQLTRPATRKPDPSKPTW
ncbi:hypothetical protein IC235_08875 [Hymenobacter sp. BT664]|uniref:Tetratricopeptide repeat protein n=1 Tax=Hymenobacter montanus TaxID=2771359 RepID=A0A927BCZ0_9BACT|nr:hypothetical protein [Hymenobacter montanus]MBD2768000.1 hypothetical protein [Hymenobacter montanus]